MKTLALILAVCLGRASAAPADPWQSDMDAAREAETRRDSAAARKGFQAALDWARAHHDSRARLSAFELAALADRENRPADAESVLKMETDGISPTVDMAPLLTLLARVEKREGKSADLEATDRRIVDAWRGAHLADETIVARSLSDLARTLLEERKYGEAAVAWREASGILAQSIGPDAPAAQLYRARFFWTEARMGQFQQADAGYRALLLSMKSGDATVRRQVAAEYAGVLHDQNRDDEASAVLKDAVRDGAGPPRLGPGITPPRLLSRREPEFSAAARSAKLQGAVVLQAEIGESGQIGHVAVIEPLGMGLDQKAVEALQTWKFSPAIRAAKPLAVLIVVEIHFRLI